MYTFDINNIYFIEAQLKYCVIHTKSGKTEIKARLMDIEDQLTPYHFLRPHRSYLINPAYISVIHKAEICMKNGQMIPISRGRVDAIKQDYLEYINKTI